MTYAGSPLLSRSTLSNGRALLLIALATVLSKKLEIDLTSFELLGVSMNEGQLTNALKWILGFQILSHFVNWFADLMSLSKWNSSMSIKLAESTFGGGGKMKGRIEYVIQNFERTLSDEHKSEKAVDVDYIKRELEDYQRSLWWHEKTAVFYVVVWNFLVPVGLATYAICIL